MNSMLPVHPQAVVWAASDDTRALLSIVALLAVVGVGLLMLAIWLVKVTRPDRDLLAPLEVMGQRRWRRSDPVWQRRQLDSVRPEGAEPLAPTRATPEPDDQFLEGPEAPGFDDLPPELAVVVATSLEVEFDHDATPPSIEIPVISPDTTLPDSEFGDESDEPDEPPEEVPLTELGTPEEGAWPAPPPSGEAIDDLSPPHGLQPPDAVRADDVRGDGRRG